MHIDESGMFRKQVVLLKLDYKPNPKEQLNLIYMRSQGTAFSPSNKVPVNIFLKIWELYLKAKIYETIIISRQ